MLAVKIVGDRLFIAGSLIAYRPSKFLRWASG